MVEPYKFLLADAILALAKAPLDAAVIAKAKEIFLYHTWLCFFALREKDPEIALAFDVAKAIGSTSGPCTVVAHDMTTNPLDAAYLNCHLFRGSSYDDVVFPAGMHTGLMVIPVAMALAEQRRKSGADFLAALIVGYELMAKIGKWSWSTPSPRRPSAIFGPLCAAVTAAPLLDLDRTKTAHAIGYALHSAQGLPADLNTHMYGMFCRAGMLSAFYAEAGGVCAPAIVEGELGFYQAFFGEAPASAPEMLGDFGRNHGVFMSREKRYPGTMLNMVAIEKARELCRDHGLNADNVEAVEIALSDRRSRHPTAHLRPPFNSIGEASSALPFQIALILQDGDIKLERYADLGNPALLALCDRVAIRFVDRVNPLYSQVAIRRRDGRVFEAEGEDHVFPPLDAAAELARHAGDSLGPEKIDRFLELVHGLENLTDLSELFRCLTPRKRATIARI